MVEQIPESLFQKYHVALVKALGEDVQKVFVKLGRELGSQVGGGRKLSFKELEKELQNYLQNDVKLAKKVNVKIEKDILNIEVEGCKVCPANDISSIQGGKRACFLPGILMGAVKSVEEVKKATMAGSQKFEVGHCKMQLKLE
jgi:predicted hydrocarbon binding protein